MSIKRTIITTIVALALVAVVAPAVTQATTIDDLLAQIAALQAQLVALQNGSGATPVPTGNVACAGVTFTRNLTVGATGSDVKCLQVLLNTNGFTLAATGAGSPGMETSYFGPITLAAVKAFQAAKGWTPANQVGPLTRGALNALIGTPGGVTPPVVVIPTGPVSATLSFDNPAAGSLINSQATADVLHINFAGTGTVTSVTLQRTGISTQNTLSNVYLYDGATRLTDGYSFNASGTLTMNGLNIAVSGSKVISVKVDTASNAVTYASSVAVALTGYTANGTAEVANVQGNTFSIVTGSAATAYMTTNTASSTASVNAGTTQYTMWSDTIQVNTRTIQLKGMNFKIIGSAPTNALANIKLFVDGVDSGVIATVAPIQGSNYAMFNFATPINLTTGTHTIDVRADIVTGANRTVQLSVQQAADVVLYDSQVGVNLAIESASSTAFVADSGTTVSILTGSSTLVVDPTFSGYTSITAGQTNAVIGKYTVHGYGEDVKVNTLYVVPLIKSTTDTSASSGNDCVTDSSGTYSSGTCGLNNVTLYFNGSQVGTQTNWTDAQMQAGTVMSFTLGSQMIIPAGQDSTLEVRADLQNASNLSYTDGTILATVKYSSSYNNAQGQSSSEIIDFPSADVATTGLTISSGSLVVSKNTGYAAT
ncbi:MAG: peptidoglycan-binding protein, partial [Endomicrobiales bacterium]|nr:peptidoglycan-binding protein [Endomicrobiales bacterium]